MADAPTVCVLGAAGDTANLGVSALLESTVAGIRRAQPDARLVVFDNGWGRRRGTVPVGDEDVDVDLVGLRLSRRVTRPESLAHMAVSARLGVPANEGVAAMRSADAVVDLSGGDSFTDLYGPKRFAMMAGQKSVALATGSPLTLLPQTYGPFAHRWSRAVAGRLVRRCEAAWSRDEASHAVLLDLLGDAADPGRHRVGVDVAFALPVRAPTRLDDRVAAWLDDPAPTFGLNVSGLLHNDPDASRRFGFAGDYRRVIDRLVERLLAVTDARLLLVPHVVAPPGAPESDPEACAAVAAAAADPERVAVLDGVQQAQEVKWVISRCDAFCGTRMHATIAALSTGVPVAALAYSPKTAGVFATCGQHRRVADLRTDGAEAVAAVVEELWADRDRVRAELARDVPAVRARAGEPFASLPAPSRGVA